MQIIVVERRDIKTISTLRRILSKSFSRTYIGWSDLFDQGFDDDSYWILGRNDRSNAIESFCRVTQKTKENRLATESGASSRPFKIPDNSYEINNFVYRTVESAVAVINFALNLIEINRGGNTYCLVSATDLIAFNLNTSIFNFRSTGKTITFDDIVIKKNGTTETWILLILDEPDRKQTIINLSDQHDA